ncbi:MAG TPA: response regulator [Planctomycetaceae bacterium]|nr:response regulator [Planctomycetaceae bacterium]
MPDHFRTFVDNGTIHLLITDGVMPELGGRATAEQLRSRRPGLKVLSISGYTDDAVLQHGVSTGMDAFLQEPFSPAELLLKVQGLLG